MNAPPHIPFIITFIAIHIKDLLPKIHPLLIRHHLIKKLDDWIEVNMGRKLSLVIAILTLVSLFAFLPPLVCWLMAVVWGKVVPPLVILTDGDWVAVVSVITTTYVGSNVWQKHVLKNQQQNNNSGDNNSSPNQPPPSTPSTPQCPPTTDPDKAALQAALTHSP